MLPGLSQISDEFVLPNPGDVQYVLVSFFFGMAIGQLIVGPMSDQFGRKPIVYFGYCVFLIGCVLSVVAPDWSSLLAGRFLQGLGAAAPRVISLAIVRDEYEGPEMARVLSVSMAVFILVPIIAPAIGQGVVFFSGWRAVHVALASLSILVAIWFALRQPETLPPSRRSGRGFGQAVSVLSEIFRTASAIRYTISTGLITGAFVAYLGTAQQVFVDIFEVGDLFPLYFGLSAASLGAAAMLNSRLVTRLHLLSLTRFALAGLTIFSAGFLAVALFFEGVPQLWLFMFWLMLVFFCLGLIYSNLQTLALEPLGHVAGTASAFIGSISLFMSLPLASFIGSQLDGTVFSLVAGFAVLGGLSSLTVGFPRTSGKT
ncbi:Bcr/CflA family drug resistance efflux transporter [Tateyamaria omphalii]|nr:Bcr/CflA family drug resistance efflux transporter [Tateyamaria omphalii]